jgi:hypothetical protein
MRPLRSNHQPPAPPAPAWDKLGLAPLEQSA